MEKRYNTVMYITQTKAEYDQYVLDKRIGYTAMRDKWDEFIIVSDDTDIEKLNFIYKKPSGDALMHSLSLHDCIINNEELAMWGIKPTLVNS